MKSELPYGLRAARLAAGMSLEQVAKKARLKPDYIRGIEAQYIRLARLPKAERELLFRTRRRQNLPPLLPGEFTCTKISRALRCPLFPRGLTIEHFHQFPAPVIGPGMEPGTLAPPQPGPVTSRPGSPFLSGGSE